MINFKPLYLGVILSLAACTPQPGADLDGRSLLDQIAGPSVDGVEKTLLDSAKQATEQQDFNRAGQIYKQLLDRRPKEKLYLLGMAESFRRLGHYDEAIGYFDQVLKQDSEQLDALEGKGLSVMAKGDTTEASKFFSQVVKQDSKRWRTLNAIGILFSLKQMVDEAMAYYDEALLYSKNNLSVLNNVGLSLLINKEYDKAIETLEKASLKAASGSEEKKRVDLNLALAYGMAGRLEEAEDVASEHLSEAALYNNMGLYAKLGEDPEVARGYLNMALMNSTVFYERAWHNLEMLEETGEGNKKRRNKRK